MTTPPVEERPTDTAYAAMVSARLADSWGLDDVEMTFLGGELDRNYRVVAHGRTYLAKLRTDDGAGARWQQDILHHLARTDLDVAVPTPVANLAGSFDVVIGEGATACQLVVLDWVDGVELVKAHPHSDDLMFSIGVAAAKVTHALAGFDAPDVCRTHHWDVLRSGDVIDECLAAEPALGDNPDVHVARQWFADVEPSLAGLPRALVHNDFNDNNVLVGVRADGTQRVSGILDFNDALRTVRVAEPAIAGAYAMIRKESPLPAMAGVLAGYTSVTPLTAAELEVAYPLAAARLCVQALTWAVRGRARPTAYGAMRSRYTLPALRAVVGIDREVAAAAIRAAAVACAQDRP